MFLLPSLLPLLNSGGFRHRGARHRRRGLLPRLRRALQLIAQKDRECLLEERLVFRLSSPPRKEHARPHGGGQSGSEGDGVCGALQALHGEFVGGGEGEWGGVRLPPPGRGFLRRADQRIIFPSI